MAQSNPKNITYVASQYGKIPTKQIAVNLKISVHAVRQIAHKLGIAMRVTPKETTKTISNNAPTEKLSKQSNSKNPANFKIRDPYNPTAPVRYEKQIRNGLTVLVERRVG